MALHPKTRPGFTLLEIMIALSLIAVLMGLAVPVTLKIQQNTRINQAEVELEMISTAVLKLAWDTGRWPNGYLRNHPNSNIEVWDLNAAAAGLVTNHSTYANWNGPYLDQIPADPWGMPYFFDPDYRVNGTDRIVVGSFGPNKAGRNQYDADNIYVLLEP